MTTIEILLIASFVGLFVFVAGCNTMVFCYFKKEQKMAVRVAPAKKITIGVFFGLITKEGKLRLQKRIEKGSPITPGVSYKGDWELPGGGIKGKDLKKALRFSSLFKEGARETKEELGITISLESMLGIPGLYRAVFVNKDKNTEDWAFMIPIRPSQWYQEAKMKRETIDVNPDELRELANRPKGEQLLSGWGKRMCRMSLGAIFASSTNPKDVNEARIMLTDIKSDWHKTEYFTDMVTALTGFRRELGQD